MNISKIIGKKNNAKKLAEIVTFVAAARKAYNNEEAVIDAPAVTTCTGKTGIKYVSDEDKAALASVELGKILAELNCLDAGVQGVNVNKELTSLVATNAVLANLTSSLTLGLE